MFNVPQFHDTTGQEKGGRPQPDRRKPRQRPTKTGFSFEPRLRGHTQPRTAREVVGVTHTGQPELLTLGGFKYLQDPPCLGVPSPADPEDVGRTTLDPQGGATRL